jgi:hypothetical protein
MFDLFLFVVIDDVKLQQISTPGNGHTSPTLVHFSRSGVYAFKSPFPANFRYAGSLRNAPLSLFYKRSIVWIAL